MKKILLLLFTICSVFTLHAQLIQPFTADKAPMQHDDRLADAYIKQFVSARFDKAVFETKRLGIPALESITRLDNSSALIDIPLADGSLQRFYIAAIDVLTKETALLYPEIKNYDILSIDGTIRGRVTYGPLGFNIMLLTPGGRQYMVPFSNQNHINHAVYSTKDYEIPQTLQVICGVKGETDSDNGAANKGTNIALGDCQLRTYKMGIAATGEFTAWAGSQLAAVNSITTTVANISLIYERDATMKMNLVTNNSVIYTNAASDPYPTVSFPDVTTLNNNTTALNTGLGAANYDIGFVFNSGWNGGLAYTPAACNSALKGGGAGGINGNPAGSIMENVIAHEAGHMFNANHTMSSGTDVSCSANLNLPTAYEPGGGSSLMAYAGSVCAGMYYQNNTDGYFHYNSAATIINYAQSLPTCGAISTISNAAPILTVPAISYTIPITTPFALTANGIDANGNTLTYTFDQYNVATAPMASTPSSTATSGPVFRSYPPSTSNTRLFPPLATILVGGFTNTWEVLPSVSRTLNFRLIARDNNTGAGCVTSESISVITNSAAGPFGISSQNTTNSFTANGSNTMTITWNVANTTAAPVSSPNVDILFSTDDGQTFPYTLAVATPNDGTETITVPNLNTTTGRIKVASSNNIFFDINNAAQTITSTCGANGATFSSSADLSAVMGNAALNLGLSPNYGSLLNISGTLSASDPSANLSILNGASCNTFSNAFNYDLFTFQVNVAGTYTFTKAGGTDFYVVANLYQNSFNPSNTCTNFITSNTTTSAINNSLSATLSPGITYVLAVGTYNASINQPVLPSNYTLNVTPPSGGNIYNGTPNPGASYNYTFVVVNTTTGNIVGYTTTGDLTSILNYPVGTYKVYGLSYDNSISNATLNGYIGGSFNSLQTALLNGTLCGNLSTNLKNVTITALPLSAAGIKLTAFGDATKVRTSWKVENEKNMQSYLVERSADAINFEPVGNVMARNDNSKLSIYEFWDETPLVGDAYYRIKGKDVRNSIMYSNTATVGVNHVATPGTAVVYPNPTTGNATVRLADQLSTAVNCELMDISGHVLQSFKTMQSEFPLDMQRFAPGIYLLRCTNETERINIRIVKQ